MLKYRALTQSDNEAIFQILSAWQLRPNGKGLPNWSLSQVQEELEQGGGFGADLDGNLVAFILFRKNPFHYEVTFLASDPRYLRGGLMWGLLESWMGDISGFEIWLEVHEHNEPARHLYRKAGFREVGSRKAYYFDGAAAILFNFP